MKKAVLAVIAALMCVVICGCTPSYDKSPDQYSKIRWITFDYSFKFYPDKDCKGTYKFNGKTYNIKMNFNSNWVSAVDTDNKDTELFNADWMYTKENDVELLYIYNINFNTKDYKDLSGNFAEHVSLKQEKV